MTSYFLNFPVDAALNICGLEFDQVREVCRLFSSSKSAVMSDLGVLMNRPSTLVSYLEEILLTVCGRVGAHGGNVFTGTISPIGVHTPPDDPDTWRTANTDIPAIMGLLPHIPASVFQAAKEYRKHFSLLTHAGHRDPITAVPCHRRVPCRLEKTVN